MSLENYIELASWLVSILLLWIGVTKRKRREAFLSFLFMQALSLLLGGLAVEMKLLSYPERFLSYAFRTNFSFEYFVFPVVSVLFNLYFPKSAGWTRKTLYSISYPTVIIIGEVIIEKYTDNIEYLHWNWFYSWSSMLITLLISYGFYRWFFKNMKKTTERT